MKTSEEFLKKNYPDQYIEHYLYMYSIHQQGLSYVNFENQNKMYVACEGMEQFQKLKNEVVKARQQADLDWFLKLAIFNEIKDVNINNLAKMFEAIEKFQI